MANAESNSSRSGSGARSATVLPFWLFLLELGLTGRAFWILLGYRFSPATYRSEKILPGYVELVWMSVVGLAALLVVIWGRRHFEQGRRLAVALFPLALVSLAVLGVETMGERWLGLKIGCFAVLAFAAATGWGIVLWGRENGEEKKWNGQMGGWMLFTAAAGLGAYFFWQQIGYLNNFALWYADSGENVRPIFNSIHNPQELFMRVNPDRPLFYDHFQPGILPFLLFGFLWSGVELVLGFQVAATLACAWPIYWIGKRVFEDPGAGLLLAAAWLVYPSTSQFIYNSAYGFHWGTFCLPLYFFALAFWLQGRWGWALGAAVWALLIKEEAAIGLGMFGVYWALFGKQRWGGVIMATVCFGYFLLITGVVLPHFNGGQYQQQGYFRDLGDTKWEILISPLSRPQVFWGKLFAWPPLYFAMTLLAPLLLLPLKKPSILFIGSVTFLFICLWNTPMAKSICFQYQASLLPVVFFAFAQAVQAQWGATRLARVRAACAGAVVAGVTLSIFLGNTFWSKENITIQALPQRLGLLNQLKAALHPQGTTVATQRLAPHLVTQKYLYLVPSLPPETDDVLYDLRDDWQSPGSTAWLESWKSFRHQLEQNSRLHLSRLEDGLLLYSREGQPLDPRGVVERVSLPPGMIRDPKEIAPGIKMVGYQVQFLPGQKGDVLGRVRVSAYSEVTAPATDQTALQCIVRVGQGGNAEELGSKFQLLGEGIWPVERWQMGKYYQDDFVVFLPLDMGQEKISIRFEAVKIGGRVYR